MRKIAASKNEIMSQIYTYTYFFYFYFTGKNGA